MSNRLIDRLMGAIRNSDSDYQTRHGSAKKQADERLVCESLKADLESDDGEDIFGDDRIHKNRSDEAAATPSVDQAFLYCAAPHRRRASLRIVSAAPANPAARLPHRSTIA